MMIKWRELATTINLFSFAYSAVHVCKKTTKLAHEKMYWSHDCCLGICALRCCVIFPFFFIYLVASLQNRHVYTTYAYKKPFLQIFVFFLPFFLFTEHGTISCRLIYLFFCVPDWEGIRMECGGRVGVSPLLASLIHSWRESAGRGRHP